MIGTSALIGLTGGIATGKSRVAELLRELGARVECADAIVHELQAPGQPGLAAITEHFGPGFLLPSGELDRARLGAHVFRDAEARRALGALIHPLVGRELEHRLREHARRGAPLIVVDIPLLIEGRVAAGDARGGLPFDAVALVYAPEATQLERIAARDGLTPEEALQRVRSQMPIEEKRALADVVIDNSGAWPETAAQVRALHELWSKRA